jgi:hypothetical protein
MSAQETPAERIAREYEERERQMTPDERRAEAARREAVHARLQASFTPEQRAKLEALVAGEKPAGRVVTLTAASDIHSERARWLWRDRFPLRGLAVAAGEKGLGKSLLTNAHTVAAITRGTLDGELFGTAADVLIVSAEDDWRSIIKPRLIAHGADLDRVHRVEVHDANGASILTLPDDVAALEARIVELRAAGRVVAMLVVDPVGAFIPEGTNTNGDAPVRRILAPLAALADRQDVAVVAVMHLNKDESKRLLQRVSGAGAFVNAARSVLAMVRDPDDPDGEQGTRRLIVHVATNWGHYAPTLASHVEAREVDTDDGDRTEIGYLIVDGESSATVDDVQRARDDNDDPADTEEAIGVALAGGPRPSREIKAQLKAELGCSVATIKRAAKRLADRGELTITTAGFPKTTTWALQSAHVLSSHDEPTSENGSTTAETDGSKPRWAHGSKKDPTEPTGANGAPTDDGTTPDLITDLDACRRARERKEP